MLAAWLVLAAFVVGLQGLFGGVAHADTDPPSVVITAPADDSITAETTVTVEFSGTDNVGVVDYECSLDGGEFSPCTSPHELSGLSVATHSFSVVATDAAFNSSQPATVTFTVAPLTAPGDLALAMTSKDVLGPGNSSLVTGASYLAVPLAPSALATSIRTAAVGSFPRAGTDYAVLSSGDSLELTDQMAAASTEFGTGPFRGNTDFDVTVLKVDLDAPVDAVCLAIDFRFYSEEFPEFVVSSYNDAFIAELDHSTWTTDGSVISAPNNFAFDPSGEVISINSSGATSMTAAEAAGTPYGGATPLLTAATAVTSGAHSLYLSIFDQGDWILDSTVLIDNLRTSTTSAGCTEGAKVVAPVAAVDDLATTTQDVPVVIDVLANDIGVTGVVTTVEVATAPTLGSAEVNPDGTITYTPNAGLYGVHFFTYSVNGSAPATVYVEILGGLLPGGPTGPTGPDIVIPPPDTLLPVGPTTPGVPSPTVPTSPSTPTTPSTPTSPIGNIPTPGGGDGGALTAPDVLAGGVIRGGDAVEPGSAPTVAGTRSEDESAATDAAPDAENDDEVAGPAPTTGGPRSAAGGDGHLVDPLVVASTGGAVSAPPGGELRLAGSGYQDCDDVFVFFDGKRIGTTSPDGAGNIALAGISIPGRTEAGSHLVTTSCSRSGEPVVQETVFEVAEAGIHRSSFVTSLTKAGQLDLSAKQLLIGAALTLLFIMLVAFPADLFNSTLEENYDEVKRKLHLPEWTSRERPHTRLARIGGFVGFMSVTSIGYGLLEPGFGFDRSSLALTLGLFLGLTALVVIITLPAEAYLWRTGDHGSLSLLPGSLLIAALCVLLSRGLGFQPGYLYGALAGVAFATALQKRGEGRLAFVSGVFMLVTSIVGWVVWTQVAEAAARPDAGFWLFVVEAALATVWVCGLETAAFSLLPMRFMAGGKLMAWSRRLWLVLFGVALFVFLQLIVRPNAGYVSGGGNRAVVVMAIAFGAFGLFSVAFWAYFRFRTGPDDDAGVQESLALVGPDA